MTKCYSHWGEEAFDIAELLVFKESKLVGTVAEIPAVFEKFLADATEFITVL
jgi:hypothetical protein